MKKEEREEIMEEVFRTTDASIRKTRTGVCRFADHVWVHESGNQIHCKHCPMGLIVKDVNDYV